MNSRLLGQIIVDLPLDLKSGFLLEVLGCLFSGAVDDFGIIFAARDRDVLLHDCEKSLHETVSAGRPGSFKSESNAHLQDEALQQVLVLLLILRDVSNLPASLVKHFLE